MTMPEVPPEVRDMQVDPTHAANVLGSIIGALGGTGQPASGPTNPGATNFNPISGTSTAVSGDSSAPVSGNFPVTQAFGVNGEGGVDLGTPPGTPVLAMFPGTVEFAGPDQGFGHMVIIDHGNGIKTVYGHLQGDFKVKTGDTVTAGQALDTVGAGIQGESTGPHLEVQVQVNGQKVDPAPYLAGGARVVGGGSAASPTPLTPEQILGAQVTNIGQAIAGQTPTHAATTTGTVTSGEPGQPTSATGDWAQDILKGVGAPVTAENVRAIQAWMQAEGGANHLNPLNTTQDAPGASNFNSVGVKTYTSYRQGLAATIQTLLNGQYSNIIQALRRGTSAAEVADAIANSPWGTGGLVKQIVGA